MRKIILAALLLFMAFQGVGNTAHQSGLGLGLYITMQPSGSGAHGWFGNWFNPSVF